MSCLYFLAWGKKPVESCADIVIVGAGVVGLGTALLLAQDGHQVTVLERDPQSPPELASDAWDAWERRESTSSGFPTSFWPATGPSSTRSYHDVAPPSKPQADCATTRCWPCPKRSEGRPDPKTPNWRC